MPPEQSAALLLFVALLAVAVAYFTRATPRRIAGALAGGVVAALYNVAVDVAADYLGLWHYPTVATSYGPPVFYVVGALGYGGVVGLIGWRLIRRFGARGAVGVVAFFVVYGPVRDYVAASLTGLLVLSGGPVPFMADMFAWGSGIWLVLLVMRLAAGPAHGDRLAR